MEIKTLTKKQLKSTLSEKKSKSREVLKNILATPYKTSFWPLISAEEEPKFNTILEKNLPCVKAPKINIPWQEIKSVSKLERKKFRIEYTQRRHSRLPDASKSKGLVLGINDVTKSLEQDSLSTVLISSDVHPRLMVQHVLDMTVLKNLPVLIVPNLRKFTKTHCGISTVALGIEKSISNTAPLSVIQTFVEQIFKSIPPPEELINSDRSLIVNNKSEHMDEEINMEDENYNQNLNNCEDGEKNSFYLEKKENNIRAFIPEERKRTPEISTVEAKKIFEVTDKIKKRAKKKYIPLKLKRVKRDSSRHKKKIKILKKSH